MNAIVYTIFGILSFNGCEKEEWNFYAVIIYAVMHVIGSSESCFAFHEIGNMEPAVARYVDNIIIIAINVVDE